MDNRERKATRKKIVSSPSCPHSSPASTQDNGGWVVDINDHLAVGQSVDVRVLSVDLEKNNVLLSLKGDGEDDASASHQRRMMNGGRIRSDPAWVRREDTPPGVEEKRW